MYLVDGTLVELNNTEVVYVSVALSGMSLQDCGKRPVPLLDEKYQVRIRTLSSPNSVESDISSELKGTPLS